ncbi:UDP pyrophosphate phosphatase [Salipaludibacillus keqinensis]|uniref:Undecaprenyl-diphosphatase n=1 Tax=Salipaludibacillus keqinensis TaxID=2045207 RepID=A0A323TCX1_9BACI|nr:undecaprenyl-diphosphate phosphatase [Salipaludibacillus keqinensis]PYZ92044.1 UDP pyrophosphate phosphatase [Salipaludibacillus keqinensis]
MDLIDILQYIFLGIVQGATEPLPVSSSGHLRIVSYFFGIDVPDLHFEVFLNGASLLAVFIVYKTDLLDMIRDTLNHVRKPSDKTKTSFRLALLLIVGTIPAVVVGGLFRDFIGGELTGIYYVAIALMITATALWLIRNLKGHKNDDGITYADAIIVGLAQTLALAPGISRSGATVVAALARKVEAETALKFSFFLSIPVSLGSLVLETSTIVETVVSNDFLGLYIIAFVSSLIVSVFAIKVFIDVVARGKLLYFAIYCFTVSILLFIFG